jgi:hypothetical protein
MTAGKAEAAAAAAAIAAAHDAALAQSTAAAREPTGPIGSVVGGSQLAQNLDPGPEWPLPTSPDSLGQAFGLAKLVGEQQSYGRSVVHVSPRSTPAPRPTLGDRVRKAAAALRGK